MHIKVKRGLDLPIEGGPSGDLRTVERPSHVALDLSPFHDTKFKLLVKPGDIVKRGQPLLYDKRCEPRKFVSPGGGEVVEVRRGLKRRLLAIVIRLAEQEEEQTVTSSSPLDRLLEGGLFAHIRMRPFGLLADPEKLPKSIFVKAVESAPFTPPSELQIQGREPFFQAGLDALAQIAPVHLVHRLGTPAKAFSEAQNVQIHTVEGPHPSANPSLHIQKIDPITGLDDRVWTLTAHEVALAGELLETGRYNVERVISLAGDGVSPEHRGFYRTRAGVPLAHLVNSRVAPGEQRLISGDPLMGQQAEIEDPLGFHHQVVTLLPDAPRRQLFHFLRLGRNKYTAHRTYLSHMRKRDFPFTTALRGEERAFIDAAIYDKVMPMRIPTVQLVKAVIAEDWDQAEVLGIYEVEPEDFALPTFICPSKVEMVEIMRDGLGRLASEVLS